jgi:hypothetical protein
MKGKKVTQIFNPSSKNFQFLVHFLQQKSNAKLQKYYFTINVFTVLQLNYLFTTKVLFILTFVLLP